MTPEATTPSATAAPTMATARVLIRRLVISPYEPMACHTDVTYSTRGRGAVGETARPQRLHGGTGMPIGWLLPEAAATQRPRRRVWLRIGANLRLDCAKGSPVGEARHRAHRHCCRLLQDRPPPDAGMCVLQLCRRDRLLRPQRSFGRWRNGPGRLPMMCLMT